MYNICKRKPHEDFLSRLRTTTPLHFWLTGVGVGELESSRRLRICWGQRKNCYPTVFLVQEKSIHIIRWGEENLQNEGYPIDSTIETVGKGALLSILIYRLGTWMSVPSLTVYSVNIIWINLIYSIELPVSSRLWESTWMWIPFLLIESLDPPRWRSGLNFISTRSRRKERIKRQLYTSWNGSNHIRCEKAKNWLVL